MATNRELIAEAKAIAKELGIEVRTDRLNNAKLTALVADLRRQLAERGYQNGPSEERPSDLLLEEPQVAPAPPAPPMPSVAPPQAQEPPTQAPEASRRRRYIVAPKKALTTRIGIVTAGEEVTADAFHAGQERAEELVRLGYLIRS